MEELVYDFFGEEITIPISEKEEFERKYPSAVLKSNITNFQTGVPNAEASETPAMFGPPCFY